MPLLEIALSILRIGFEQIVQWRYGAMGIVALLLLSIGLRARNSTCASVGAVILLLLMIPS
ncbi:hypothetical protein OG194_25205 [Streptomyces sp. NBC_01288]|uniref:hypothetical protein n=1 Tax=Streptomyces sp. NBC_01288 TaxID=2903814 RepID=UPI002E131679|nr:hypothetical protein OG194_25205 [Streptomyces sp. NBC_01288]